MEYTPKYGAPAYGTRSKRMNILAQIDAAPVSNYNNHLHVDLNMNGKRLRNIGDPEDETDAVSKKHMVDHLSQNVLLSDGTTPLQGTFNANNFKIMNVLAPEANMDCVNKEYTDAAISQLDAQIGVLNTSLQEFEPLVLKKDGSVPLEGDLNLDSHQLTNVPDPINDTDGVNKIYVDEADAVNALAIANNSASISSLSSQVIKKDGSVSMQADLNLNNHKLTNVATPSSNQDATTKVYVDAINTLLTNGKLNVDGTSAMTGALNMNNQNIANVKDIYYFTPYDYAVPYIKSGKFSFGDQLIMNSNAQLTVGIAPAASENGASVILRSPSLDTTVNDVSGAGLTSAYHYINFSGPVRGYFIGTSNTTAAKHFYLGYNAGGNPDPDIQYVFGGVGADPEGLFACAGIFPKGKLIAGYAGSDIPSAMLAAISTTKGFLPPVMSTSQRTAISSPAEGLMVYDNTLHSMMFYNGSAWTSM